MLHVEQSKLRFWDKAFADHITIRRSPTRRRQYTLADIELLKTIQHLAETDGLRLSGVKQRLSKNTTNETRRAEAMEHLNNAKQQLQQLRSLLARPYDMDDIRVERSLVQAPPEDAQGWQLNDTYDVSPQETIQETIQDNPEPPPLDSTQDNTTENTPTENRDTETNTEELPSLFGDEVKAIIAPVKKIKKESGEATSPSDQNNGDEDDDKRQLSLF